MGLEALGEQTLIPAGTWEAFKTYRRSIVNCSISGCDVPTHLYSFSFNLNPDWSKELCDQEEILECK